MRPTVGEALQAMIGREIGALFRTDGGARLQWPEVDGTLPAEMGRYIVRGAHIEGGAVTMELANEDVSFTLCFGLDALRQSAQHKLALSSIDDQG